MSPAAQSHGGGRCAGALALALGLAPLVACGDTVIVGSDVLWRAHFETGDFSEWTSVQGSAAAFPAPNTIEISRERAHRGGAAAKLTLVTGTDGTQASAVLTRATGLPPEAYYSAWYFLPRAVTVSPYWVIFKIRQRTIANDASSETELYDVNLTSLPSGEMSLRLYDHRTAANVPLATTSPVVPTGTWFQIEAFYRNASDSRGRLTLWLDGELLVDVDGQAMANNPWVGWSPASVAVTLVPSTATLYVDDCAVSLGRVGRDGLLDLP